MPTNDPPRDIDFALASPNAALLVGTIDDQLVASVMVGHDGHRGWLYYVAVDPSRRSDGHGKAMVAAAESWLKAAGAWKAQLLVRETNRGVIDYYRQLGYVERPIAFMQKVIDG